MWLVPVTFALVVVIVCGLYWVLVARPENESRHAVASRLRPARHASPERASGTLVKPQKRLSGIPTLESVLEKTGLASSRLQQLLDSADVNLTIGRFLIGSALLGAAAYLSTAVFLRQYGVAWLFGVLAAATPYMIVRRKRTVRIRRFEEQFPEAIDLIARAMRAGHGLSAGLGMVADEIKPPVGREFRLLYDWQNFGMSLPEALQRFAQRVPLLDARFFVTSVLTQRESGGNLAEVLSNLTKVIRERFQVKRQIRVISAHGRMTGAVLGGLPPSLAVYFFAVHPQYLEELTSSPLGVRLIIGALILQIIGVLIIRKLVDIEY